VRVRVDRIESALRELPRAVRREGALVLQRRAAAAERAAQRAAQRLRAAQLLARSAQLLGLGLGSGSGLGLG